MTKPSDTDSERKSNAGLSRKAIAGWTAVVFIVSAWMFVIGVMVGRGTAPISFDINHLKQTLESLKQAAEKVAKGQPRPEPSEMKNKSDLGFYDSLPKNREEPEALNLAKSPPVPAKPEPPAQKTTESATPPKTEKPATTAPPVPAAKAEKPAPAAVSAPAPAPIPAPAAAPPPAAVAAPGKPLTVQIAAVKSQDEARRLLDRLRQSGYAAYIEPITTPDKGTWYRLRMGEFPSKEFARSTLDRLQKDGFKPDLVPK
jgi:cell division septation protein DedD